ncbi:MAG: macrocin O-methyltransferase [Candidatus Wildermuthbacteria bacterium]|nr:macrocin O-methyltransferase [Candidatus Wildermuthbacteria bacterium]
MKNIITKIKAVLRKNQTFVDAYYKGRFLAAAFVNNIFHLGRLMLFLRISPYTMVEYKRLANACTVAEFLERNRIPGAFVECGVWKGGAIGLMAKVADKAKSGRKIWLFDSFEGLPEPTKKDGATASTYAAHRDSGALRSIEKCVGPLEDVKQLFFSVLKLNPENIIIKKGWFQDVLPKEKQSIGPIALLRLDADWYESTKCILDNLYDNVVSGGYVLIDDYGHWQGCKKAVDEFLATRKLQVQLIPVDYAGVYFKK